VVLCVLIVVALWEEREANILSTDFCIFNSICMTGASPPPERALEAPVGPIGG